MHPDVKPKYKVGDLVGFKDPNTGGQRRGKVIQITEWSELTPWETPFYVIEEFRPRTWELIEYDVTPSADVPMSPYELMDVEINQMIVNDAKKRK